MAYPNGVDRFPVKLNKKLDGGVYAVEEEVALGSGGGSFEGFLAHDNIVGSSVRVFTGPHFTGEELTTWTLSVPAEAPWRRLIRIFGTVGKVYVTYETPGDTVDADDVNVLQEAIAATQTEMERYKSEGEIDGGTFTGG